MIFPRVNRYLKKRRGFDLIQVGLYAIAIAILMGVVVMTFNTTFMDGNRRAVATEEVKTLANACSMYTVYNNGTPPADLDALFVGIAAGASVDGMAHNNFVSKAGWAAGSINDPWGNAYQYNVGTRTISVEDPHGNPIQSTF